MLYSVYIILRNRNSASQFATHPIVGESNPPNFDEIVLFTNSF